MLGFQQHLLLEEEISQLPVRGKLDGIGQEIDENLGQCVAITLELLEGGLAAAQSRLRASHRLLGYLEPAGVLLAARLEDSNRRLQVRLGA